MMRTQKTKVSGFTLIELLVVIAIIMILAAILTPVVENAFKRGKLTRACTEMSTIVTAINSYVNEYGVMPVGPDNGYNDHVYVGVWGYDMAQQANPKKANYIYNILRGMDTTNNPRKMVFLEIPDASLAGNCTLSGRHRTYTVSEGYYLDPWGNPYFLVMDTDSDGQIGGLDVNANDGRPVLVYSELQPYIRACSSTKIATFPGVRAGVMCFGPTPGETNSFMMSWQ